MATTNKPLTYYVDTPSIRVFQMIAGESLDDLTAAEAWDLIAILAQAVSDADTLDFAEICTDRMAEMLNIEISDRVTKCLEALNGFPTNQVPRLVVGILAVGFGA